MDVPQHHRPVVLLIAVIFAQILLLAFQIKRDHDVRLVRVWSAELLMPLQRVGTFVVSKTEGAWFGYLDLRHARDENRKLAEEVGRLKLENQRLESRAAESARLARLLDFRQSNANVPMIAAEVIGGSADPNSHAIFINRGERDGLRRNMAVVTPDGVVGKIFEAFPHTAEVLLITDRESGVGALLAQTRTHGVVKGTGGGLWMDYVANDVKPPSGEEILTSGEDRIFSKDLPVGTVRDAKTGFPFMTVEVDPAAHLDQLEEVLVLTSNQPLKSEEESAAKAKSPEAASDAKHENATHASSAGASSAAKVKLAGAASAHATSSGMTQTRKPPKAPAAASAPAKTPPVKAQPKPASVASQQKSSQGNLR